MLKHGGCLLAFAFVISLWGYKVNYGYSIPGLLIALVPFLFYFGIQLCRFWIIPWIVLALAVQPVLSPIAFVIMSNARLIFDPPDFSKSIHVGNVKVIDWGSLGFYSSSVDLQLYFSEDGDEKEIYSVFGKGRQMSNGGCTQLKWVNTNYYLETHQNC
ncbi:hypothetical protein GCM10007094_27410 [Pseudovibrio japonicus]|uniref:Uncharacterized protein n=1 Tax=Pseudovibrio japonicus TaxID=366534 RepID=A0ABQ3EMZ8_9HYPH|nr:hypothetical protein GCM10007094_27410 [Pseudovibrio japonicus]